MRKFDEELFREVADSVERRLEKLMSEDPLFLEAVRRIKEGTEVNSNDPTTRFSDDS